MSEKIENPFENKELKTIIIFGVSSFVGSSLAEFFKHEYNVIGTYHKNPIQIPGVLTIPCDVLSKDEVQLPLFAFKPDFAIYCAGVSSVNQSHENSDRSDALNTSGLFNVSEYCQRYRTKICYISSGFIFAGEKKNYFEMDTPDATTTYGKSLASAEFYIQKTSLNYLIFRCCRLYGRNANWRKPTWFEKLQERASLGKTTSLETNIHTGYLDVFYLAMVMKMTFDKQATNRLFQITSRDVVSMYDFAKFYSNTFTVSKELFQRTRYAFPLVPTASLAPVEDELYFKMDTNNIEGYLNIELPTVEESVEYTFSRLNGKVEKAQSKNQGDGVKFI